jgi:hypothetical protein
MPREVEEGVDAVAVRAIAPTWAADDAPGDATVWTARRVSARGVTDFAAPRLAESGATER